MEVLFSWLETHGIKVIAIVIAALVINRIGRKFIKRTVEKAIKEKDLSSEKKREDTLIRIFNGVLKIALWIFVIMTVLPEFGIEVAPILAGAGVLGVALGFGAQYMIRDYLAGLAVILENQYRVGDVVCLDGTCGLVEDITLRKTVMRDLDGKVMHFPNGNFKVTANMTKDYSRAHMNISVAYKEDLDKVIALINKVGKEMAQEERWKEDILSPIQVMGSGPNKFGDSGIEIKVLGDTKPLKQWDVMRDFRRRLKAAFDKEGVEIPFPQVSVWSRDKK